jgi:hypothetical protein
MYEWKILNNSKYLFPGYFCFQFKKPVNSIYGTGIPDLVLIDQEYREWIIVEVELEHHRLQGDVLDQVVKFAAGEYKRGHAEYLLAKHSELDTDRLVALVTGTQPRIQFLSRCRNLNGGESYFNITRQLLLSKFGKMTLEEICFASMAISRQLNRVNF